LSFEKSTIEFWLSQLEELLKRERYSPQAAHRGTVVGRGFLTFLSKRHIAVEVVTPTDITLYLQHALRLYRRRHRLAAYYSDDIIAGILNRQGRRTANGQRFTANQVGGLRRHRNIPRYEPPAEPPTGELATIRKAAQILGVSTSTIHRWLKDGFIAGEQVTPGAPWQIRITDALRARFVEQAPPGYLPMLGATMKLGVSRQTVLQRVKRGELEAMLVTRGRRNGLRIRVVDDHPNLSESPS
jgi:predicted DNA-binding transcriptional regulator AlpA